MGRNPSTDEILFGPLTNVRLAIPSVCILEALTTSEGSRKRYNALIGELERQIKEFTRNAVSSRIRPLVHHLKQSVIELDQVFNESETRLNDCLEKVRADAELTGLTSRTLGDSLSQLLIDDPTESLILSCLLGHAKSNPTAETIFYRKTADISINKLIQNLP